LLHDIGYCEQLSKRVHSDWLCVHPLFSYRTDRSLSLHLDVPSVIVLDISNRHADRITCVPMRRAKREIPVQVRSRKPDLRAGFTDFRPGGSNPGSASQLRLPLRML
jgi:hypothetical protein